MTRTGLDNLISNFPPKLKNKKVGIVCHAASIAADYTHIIDAFLSMPCKLAALFGPQHGMFGQTQDNMVEWEGNPHPTLKIPVYSLYGRNRKPAPSVIESLDALMIDLAGCWRTAVYVYLDNKIMHGSLRGKRPSGMGIGQAEPDSRGRI